jgi:hypothetical protein
MFSPSSQISQLWGMVMEALCPSPHLPSEGPQGQCPCLLPPFFPPKQPLTLHHPCARLPTPTHSPESPELRQTMENRGPLATSPQLLLLLLLLLLPTHAHQRQTLGHIVPTQVQKQDRVLSPCVFK